MCALSTSILRQPHTNPIMLDPSRVSVDADIVTLRVSLRAAVQVKGGLANTINYNYITMRHPPSMASNLIVFFSRY